MFASTLADLAGSRGPSLRERYAPDLTSARVISEPLPIALGRLGSHQLRRLSGWDSIIAANEAFGHRTSAELRRSGLLKGRPTVFSYSYAARRIFQDAKEAGCTTVLGQIDPGPFEDELVARVARQHGLGLSILSPPEAYWKNWRLECDLADHIVVNSSWSRDALSNAGINDSKIRVIPLAYTPPHIVTPRQYPDVFTPQRPLRLLFLGQINIRKGAVELLQAMERLTKLPVRLSLVGRADEGLQNRFERLPNVDWEGPTVRGGVNDHYRVADAFILPTHSDGFALTQLEAASHSLPLIVSTNCGNVVKDGYSGLAIQTVSTQAIEAAIRRALEPRVLAKMSLHVRENLSEFSPARIVDQFETLAEEVHLL